MRCFTDLLIEPWAKIETLIFKVYFVVSTFELYRDRHIALYNNSRNEQESIRLEYDFYLVFPSSYMIWNDYHFALNDLQRGYYDIFYVEKATLNGPIGVGPNASIIIVSDVMKRIAKESDSELYQIVQYSVLESARLVGIK